jgi:hypothetical protein
MRYENSIQRGEEEVAGEGRAGETGVRVMCSYLQRNGYKFLKS